jgi:hypothetical protein
LYAGFGVLGGVGSIEKSCNAVQACESAGSGALNKNYDDDDDQYDGYGDGPILSNLNSCCNTDSVCKLANWTKLPTNCKYGGKSGKVGKVLKF